MGGIKEIINISKKDNKVINCIQNGNNMTANSSKEINNHFTSAAKNIKRSSLHYKSVQNQQVMCFLNTYVVFLKNGWWSQNKSAKSLPLFKEADYAVPKDV